MAFFLAHDSNIRYEVNGLVFLGNHRKKSEISHDFYGAFRFQFSNSLMKGRNAFWWFLPSGMDFGVLCVISLRRHWLWLREPLQYDPISSSWVTACYCNSDSLFFVLRKRKKNIKVFLGTLSGMMWVMSRHVLFFRSQLITKSPRDTFSTSMISPMTDPWCWYIC